MTQGKPVKVYYHGVMSNPTERWNFENTLAYLDLDYNFIAVDWSEYAYIYIIPLILIEDMSKLIGNFFINICQEQDISFADIHMIGHSIGAHLAGEVGKCSFRSHMLRCCVINCYFRFSDYFFIIKEAKDTSNCLRFSLQNNITIKIRLKVVIKCYLLI